MPPFNWDGNVTHSRCPTHVSRTKCPWRKCMPFTSCQSHMCLHRELHILHVANPSSRRKCTPFGPFSGVSASKWQNALGNIQVFLAELHILKPSPNPCVSGGNACPFQWGWQCDTLHMPKTRVQNKVSFEEMHALRSAQSECFWRKCMPLATQGTNVLHASDHVAKSTFGSR